MAHIEKCTGAEARALIKHDERAHGTKDDHIDPKLRHLNYNLCERGNSIQYMNDRIAEISQGKTVRKDAVRAISVIITCPKNLPDNEHEKFLQAAYDFCEKEFGRENMISGWVHRDEPGAQDHIHAKSIPVVFDEKTGKEKLSAKNLITRTYLKRFHPRLQKYVENVLGHPVSIINGATAGKNKELIEKKLEVVQQQLQVTEAKLEALCKELAMYQEIKDRIDDIKSIKPKVTVTGALKGVTLEEFERMQRLSCTAESVKADLERVRKECADLQRHVPSFDETLRHIENETKIKKIEQAVSTLPEKYQKQIQDAISEPVEARREHFEDIFR